MPFEVPVVSDNWICWSLFLDEWRSFFLETLPNNMWWCRCCLTIFFKVFWPRQKFRNILCWLEILNYCPDGGNGNFHCSSSFLKATSLICEAQLSFQIKSLLLSHHHSTCALMSEILESVLQTVQKQLTYRQYHYILTDLYRQCAIYTYIYSVHTVYC